MRYPNQTVQRADPSRFVQRQIKAHQQLPPVAHPNRTGTLMNFERSKSLQELDGQDWGEPTFDSHLVTECHRLRRVPLRDFTVEDLRITIGQQIGLDYLIPLALERLEDDPFAEGAYYPCDLLVSVLRAEVRF